MGIGKTNEVSIGIGGGMIAVIPDMLLLGPLLGPWL
jgi:hypothetical protein